MQNIFPLPQIIINKISAGEVIERPAYAVKELLDNAIDAGADEIKIIIEESGLKKITVIDNGVGMTAEDSQEAWKLHTTSKLREENDLNAIKTLGFRGEALTSIAAISKLTIKSKTQNEKIGAQIEVMYGKLIDFSPVGLPNGTEVSLYNLFANVPARKKFLKSQRAEFRNIVNTVSSYAIIYSNIRFIFLHNDKLFFDLHKNTEQKERIISLYGNSLREALVPFSFEKEHIRVSGWISKPQTNVLLFHRQHIFINNRPVSDKTIISAINDAYSQVHARTMRPIAFVFLYLPYEMVDVNVHPRKEEVRLHNPEIIYDTVFQTITRTLQNQTSAAKRTVPFQTAASGLSIADAPSRPGLTDSFAAGLLRQNVLSTRLGEFGRSSTVQQVHRLYIVQEAKEGIEIVDQHAAHERILYEKLLGEFKSKRKQNEQYALRVPQLFEVSLADSELLEEYLSLFHQLGFTIEKFKDQAFLLQRVPLLFKDRNNIKLLSEMLVDLQREKKMRDIDTVSKRMLAYLACRAAVKAGDVLTEEQMRDLLRQLEQTENNTTCPHGRPTRIEIVIGKIHKLFKRK